MSLSQFRGVTSSPAGQTRTVHITRLTIENTVEDRILALQDRKRAVVSAALDEQGRPGGVGGSKLTMEDLKFLFSGEKAD